MPLLLPVATLVLDFNWSRAAFCVCVKFHLSIPSGGRARWQKKSCYHAELRLSLPTLWRAKIGNVIRNYQEDRQGDLTIHSVRFVGH